jgi:hypothetical protein
MMTSSPFFQFTGVANPYAGFHLIEQPTDGI